MQLSKAIRISRQKALLSQEAFASELNVSVSTINRWENGKARPSITALRRIKAFCAKNDLSFIEIEETWFAQAVEEQ